MKKYVCFRYKKNDDEEMCCCLEECKLWGNLKDNIVEDEDIVYLDMDDSSIEKMIDMLHRLRV